MNSFSWIVTFVIIVSRNVLHTLWDKSKVLGSTFRRMFRYRSGSLMTRKPAILAFTSLPESPSLGKPNLSFYKAVGLKLP